MERDHVICICHNITYGQLIDAYKSGYTTYLQLFNKLHFGVGCGGCRSRIKQMIYYLEDEIKKEENA